MLSQHSGRLLSPREETLMNSQARRLRLRKSTLREVTSALAQGAMGGSVTFTGNTCTGCNSVKCTANTCAACPTWEMCETVVETCEGCITLETC